MNDAEYQAALVELDALLDRADAEFASDATAVHALVAEIEKYEEVHYPTRRPTPEEAAEFRREQEAPPERHCYVGRCRCGAIRAVAVEDEKRLWPDDIATMVRQGLAVDRIPLAAAQGEAWLHRDGCREVAVEALLWPAT